jgi:histidine triad (HIT) family protein
MSDCIFCKIVDGDIPSDQVYQNDELIAFRDLNPQAPVHVLIIPRKHIASVADAAPQDAAMLGRILLVAGKIAEQESIGANFRVVTNRGEQAGQSVFHVHFHLLGGRTMEWPPG